MSVCNNDVTYNKKWDTPENLAAFKKLESKYFERVYYTPSCPVSWAPEVLALLERIDSELGIERNTTTIYARYPQGNPYTWFIKDPIRGLFYAIKSNFITYEPSARRGPLTFKEKCLKVVNGFTFSIKYGIQCIKVLKTNKIINKITKPKFRLDQVKEKYGYLTLYFTCSPCYDSYIKGLLTETVIKLALKEAYYPIETLWNSTYTYTVDDKYHPDTVEVINGVWPSGEKHTRVKKTVYRNAMKEMGIDIEAIKAKADLIDTIKVDPVDEP